MNLMPNWHGFRDDETEAQLEARASELGIHSGVGDEWLRIGGLKMAIDGGTSSHTAYMYEPFEGETEVGRFNRLDTADLYRYYRRGPGARLGHRHPLLRRPQPGHGGGRAGAASRRNSRGPTRGTTSSTRTSPPTMRWT